MNGSSGTSYFRILLITMWTWMLPLSLCPYIGTTIYGKRKRAKYRNMPEHHTDPKDWVIHENTHESIIARPDFDEVQRIWNRASEKYKESVERGLARQIGARKDEQYPSRKH